MCVWHQSPVADGVDAAVKSEDVALADESVDFIASESDPPKLIPRNNAELLGRERRNRRPDSTRTSFSGPRTVNV
jgi:hypothetical protein